MTLFLRISTLLPVVALLCLALLPQSTLAAPGDCHYIQSIGARVYDKPDLRSSVLIIIGLGRRVFELDRRGDWVLVHINRTGGIQGWAQVENLSPTDVDGLIDPCPFR